MHPEEGLPVYVLNGPFGPYIQLGDVVEDGVVEQHHVLPDIGDVGAQRGK